MPVSGRLLFFCLCSLLIVSCNDQILPSLDKDDTILAFGDSLTSGVGAARGQTYPQHLAKLTGLTVINAGISGETTSQGSNRFAGVLDKHQPSLVVLLEGGNDILRGHPQQQTKANLMQMIEDAHVRDISLVLIGVPEKKLFSDSAPLYEELAESYNLVFDGEVLSDLLRSSQYKSDPIHLNSAGYEKLAERIKALLVEHKALNY